MPSPRRGMRRQPNGPGCDVRAALFVLLGLRDLTQINGLRPYLALKFDRRVRRRPLPPGRKRKAHYLLALPGAEQQDLRRHKVLSPLGEPGRGAPQALRGDDRTNRHRPGPHPSTDGIRRASARVKATPRPRARSRFSSATPCVTGWIASTRARPPTRPVRGSIDNASRRGTRPSALDASAGHV